MADDLPTPFTTTRIFFTGLDDAAEALALVLIDARKTKEWYRFSPLNAQQILVSGLLLEGRISSIASRLEKLDGAVRMDE